MHIRCITHVINLIVPAFLFGIDEVDDSPDEVDYYDKDLPIHYDVEEDEELIALENEELLDSETIQSQFLNADEEAELLKSIVGQSPLKRVSDVFICPKFSDSFHS